MFTQTGEGNSGGGGEKSNAIREARAASNSQKQAAHLATSSAVVCPLCVCASVHECNIDGKRSGVKSLPTSFDMASIQGEISLRAIFKHLTTDMMGGGRKARGRTDRLSRLDEKCR